MKSSKVQHKSQINTHTAWWGDFEYGHAGENLYWQISSLQLWVKLMEREWRLSFQENLENLDAETMIVAAQDKTVPDTVTQERYLYRETPSVLRILPALAPRMVVVRPVVPLRIPAGECITLYVTTPLWMQFQSGDTTSNFRELAIVRPSDTWFGSNTREGELCYAARSPGQLELSDLKPKYNQAITCVEIHNSADNLLEFDRINLPVTFLSLFADSENRLWTEKITLLRDENEEFARLDISETASSRVNQSRLVANPREIADGGLLLRAFNALFA